MIMQLEMAGPMEVIAELEVVVHLEVIAEVVVQWEGAAAQGEVAVVQREEVAVNLKVVILCGVKSRRYIR